MAKHINGYHEKKIVDVINTWSIDEKLTWDALCDRLVRIIGKRPSRQSLSSHVRIAESFSVKKATIKSGSLSHQGIIGTLSYRIRETASRRIHTCRQLIFRLFSVSGMLLLPSYKAR